MECKKKGCQYFQTPARCEPYCSNCFVVMSGENACPYKKRSCSGCDALRTELSQARAELETERAKRKWCEDWLKIWCERWEDLWDNIYTEFNDENHWLFSIADEHRMDNEPNMPLWAESRGSPVSGDDAGYRCKNECSKFPNECDGSCPPLPASAAEGVE